MSDCTLYCMYVWLYLGLYFVLYVSGREERLSQLFRGNKQNQSPPFQSSIPFHRIQTPREMGGARLAGNALPYQSHARGESSTPDVTDQLKMGQIFSQQQAHASPSASLLDLPTELLVYIASFLPTTRDKATLRYVSRRLRSVSETPSLWSEFVWHYYHAGDEGCVNNVLRICGQHVKLLSFPNPVTSLERLVATIQFCHSVTELSLPSMQLDHDQLRKVLLHMQHLQTLDIQWSSEIKEVLEVVGINLKVLTIRIQTVQPFIAIDFSTKYWIEYWIMKRFVPQRLNIFISVQFDSYRDAIWNSWIGFNSNSPTGCIGHVKLYGNYKVPLDFFPVLPKFQLDFGQAATSPFVRASSVGLPGLETNLLLLTGCTYNGSTVHKAVMKRESLSCYEYLNQSHAGLEFLTELALLFGGSLRSKHLEQIGLTCPTLQRLNLRTNKQCLVRLQGLCTIASRCHNLQGLNLMGIPFKEIENQARLWSVLSGMKLTHLGIDIRVLLPSTNDEKVMIGYFVKCSSLHAIESDGHGSSLDNVNFTVLSHFPSLVYFAIYGFYPTFGLFCRNTTALPDLLSSCKGLKYLNYNNNMEISWKSAQLMQPFNLQELNIDSLSTDLPDIFMHTVSAPGNLIHVLLDVKSVTSKGVAVLVRNSPKLMTFHATLHENGIDIDGAKLGPTELEPSLRQELSQRPLFVIGSYLVKMHEKIVYRSEEEYDDYDEYRQSLAREHIYTTNLCSLWF